MQISLDGQAKTARSVLALGMFDGVHLGHQVLLQKARALSNRQHVPLVACTFTTHPMMLVAPEKCPPMLTTLEERAHMMEAQGVNILCAQPFDWETMNTMPEKYVARLCERFHPRFIVVGYNFTFGKAGEGNAALLTALGEVFGFAAQVVPQITFGGREVSSTAIRAVLQKGEVQTARELLGRPYQRQATVVGRTHERISLVMMENGKQDVPKGVYRIALEEEGRLLPATLVVRRGGEADAMLFKPIALGAEVSIRFYQGQG